MTEEQRNQYEKLREELKRVFDAKGYPDREERLHVLLSRMAKLVVKEIEELQSAAR